MKINLKGFTLIEVMIVIAITGILLAIAIPNFIRYQLKSRTTEAITNIGSIKTLEFTFASEYNVFCPCGLTLLAPGTFKQAWTPVLTDLGFLTIGFLPVGDVYFSYEVDVAGGVNIVNVAKSGLVGRSGAFCASALGDLDGNTLKSEFAFTTDFAIIGSTGQIAKSATQNNIILNLNTGEF